MNSLRPGVMLSKSISSRMMSWSEVFAEPTQTKASVRGTGSGREDSILNFQTKSLEKEEGLGLINSTYLRSIFLLVVVFSLLRFFFLLKIFLM